MVPIYECGMYINSESIDLDKLREVDEALVTALGDGLTVQSASRGAEAL